MALWLLVGYDAVQRAGEQSLRRQPLLQSVLDGVQRRRGATPKVASQPLASYTAPAHPSPVAVSALPTPEPATTGQIRPPVYAPVGGGAAGWSAVGGSPIVVSADNSADSLSRRYGVPVAALLSANGLNSPSEVHGGMHIVVPVYNAAARGAASPAPIASATAKSSAKHGLDTAEADDARAKKPSDKAKSGKLERDAADKPDSVKAKEKARKSEKDADASEPAKARKDEAKKPEAKPLADAKADKTKNLADAKADKAKSGAADKVEPKTDGKAKAEAKAETKPVKTAAIDPTPTGHTGSAATTTAQPETSAQADAAGTSRNSAGRRAGASFRASKPATTTASTFPFPRAPRCGPRKTASSPTPAAR